ncbi:MAG: 3,4-dihydroxy-2-butanone-4-phosphate synthase [Enterobacterales bacterium]
MINDMKKNKFKFLINKINNSINSLRHGFGILLLDDKSRENEIDMVFYADNMTIEQMATTIRYGSGIVCLCITEDRRKKLQLPMMVNHNSSKYKTAFTVSIESAKNITTGVSAADRITTIKTAIKDNINPLDLNRPGHVFPVVAKSDGVFKRNGHTEGAIDLLKIAGLKETAVICEVTNNDGTMTNLNEIKFFYKLNKMPILTIDDIINYRYIKENNIYNINNML